VGIHERFHTDAETPGEPGVAPGVGIRDVRIEPGDAGADRDVRHGAAVAEIERAVAHVVVDRQVSQLLAVGSEDVMTVVRDESGLRSGRLEFHLGSVGQVEAQSDAIGRVVIDLHARVEERGGPARELAAEQVAGVRRDLDGPFPDLGQGRGAHTGCKNESEENPELHKGPPAATGANPVPDWTISIRGIRENGGENGGVRTDLFFGLEVLLDDLLPALFDVR
jgi:hypothetical protein